MLRTSESGAGGLPEENYFLGGEAVGFVYEVRGFTFEIRCLGSRCPHRLDHLGVVASDVTQRTGRETVLTLRAALADLIDEGVKTESGEVFELLARLLDAELDAQSVQHVPPRLLLGTGEGAQTPHCVFSLIPRLVRSRCDGQSISVNE